MDDKKITDGMRKEGKPFRNIMISGYILTALVPLAIYLTNDKRYSAKDFILIIVSTFLIGSIGLYGWLYAIKYKLTVTEEKIMLQTLFTKVDINISDIKNYTCNRYRKSLSYQFNLYTKDKRVLVNKRYKEELEKILIANNIEQKLDKKNQ